MSKFNFLFLFIMIATGLSAQKNSKATKVEKQAMFPGGVQAMMTYIKTNLQYPKEAMKVGLGGKCFLKFIVNADGSVSGVQVLKGVPGCPQCDEEAVRVVSAMPAWEPAELDGKKVKCYFNLPINFKVEDPKRSNTVPH